MHTSDLPHQSDRSDPSGLVAHTGLRTVMGALVLFAAATVFAAADLPRLEGNGRVLVLDDFEQGLDAWESPLPLQLGGGPGGGNALTWVCSDVATTITYKHVGKIENPGRYTRIAMDARAWDDEGREGPGVAIYGSLTWGGLPWQLTDIRPSWGLYDRRPVFGKEWRALSYSTRYPEWYMFSEKADNAKTSFYLAVNAMFAKSATLMIDNVRLIADPVEVLGMEQGGVWGDGRPLADGGYRYEYRIPLRNLTQQPLTVKAEPKLKSLARFRGGLTNERVILPPGGDGAIAAWIEIPAAAIPAVPDLYHEELVVTLSPVDFPGTEQDVSLPATKPLGALKRPFILHPPAFWVAEREGFAKLSPDEQQKRLKAAESAVRQPVPFPTQPTQVTKKKINNGSEVEITGWSDADMKLFTANWGAIRALGEAWQLTRDERYAKRAVEMMAEFAAKYAAYPWHGNYEISDQGQAKIAMNSLHESYWLIDLTGAYELILDTPALTAELRAKIADQFLRPAARHQTVICSAFCNMTSTRYMSAALCGFLIDDANLVHYAIYGHHGLKLSAEVSISADGFLSEIPINYHWANLREMVRPLQVFRNAGLRLDVAEERIRRACDTPYLRAMPNLMAPPFGSCGYGTGAGYGDYHGAYEYFQDPKYQQLCIPAEARKIIDGLPSMVFQEGGLAVLRESGRVGPERMYLAILSTNRRRAHDGALHFVLCAEGALLCPSPGTLYNAGGDTKWNSPWNSTIYLDDQSQKDCWGKILAHEFGGPAQMALIDAGPVYPGATLQRAVALANGLVFIVDRVVADKPRMIERVQMVGEELVRPPADKGDLTRDEGEHIRFQGVRLDGDWSAEWRCAAGQGLRLVMAGEPGSAVFWGENRVNGFKPQMNAPTVLVRRQAKETLFLTVMEPFRNRPATLEAVRRLPAAANSATTTVAVEARTATGSSGVFTVNFAPGAETLSFR